MLLASCFAGGASLTLPIKRNVRPSTLSNTAIPFAFPVQWRGQSPVSVSDMLQMLK
jgi:hypothetical protein